MQLTLKQGDCLELMKELPEKSIDMILCDLPYGVTQNRKDIELPLSLLWEQYCRVIKDNGAIILFAQGIFFVDLVNSQRKLFRYDLIWDKVLTSGFLNAKRMPLRRHEQMAVFYKKCPVYHPQFTKGKPLHGRGTTYLSKEVVNNNYGEFHHTADVRKGCTEKYPTSIITRSKSHPSVAKHRTEKPTSLCEWLVRTYTDEGMTVLDNCMGSGSVGEACINTNRNFIGYELDPECYSVAEKRLRGCGG